MPRGEVQQRRLALEPRLRKLWWLGVVGFTLQLAVLVVYSSLLYTRYDLTRDFAVFHQAWFLIAHGTFNPFNTVDGFPFWRNHLEVVMWPLALLYWVSPHPFDLLVLQDLALAGAGLAAYCLGLEVLDRRAKSASAAGGGGSAPPDARGAGLPPVRRRVGSPRDARGSGLPPVPVAIGLLLVLSLNPWLYQAASFDFHFEALAALFTVLAARDLYNGRPVRALVFAVLTLLNGDVAGTYVIGLGLTALAAARATRRAGAAMLALGVGWVALISALGANLGSSFASGYAYLVDPGQRVTLSTIVEGVVRHPSRALQVLDARWRTIVKNLLPVGLVGVLSPYALGVSLVVLVTGVLQASPGYIAPGYQNLVVFFLVAAGTVMVLDWLAARDGSLRGTSRVEPDEPLAATRETPGSGSRRSSVLAGALGAVLLAVSLGYGASELLDVPGAWLLTSPSAVAALDRAAPQVPAGAQVIASQGVMGRFAGRRYVYQVVRDVAAYPVRARQVVFVLAAGEGIEQVAPPAVRADVTAVRRLGASLVARGGGVTVLSWRAPPGAQAVALPSGSVTYGSRPAPSRPFHSR